MREIVYIICIIIIGIIVGGYIDKTTRMNTINQETIQRIDSLEQQVIDLENKVTELENQINYLYH